MRPDGNLPKLFHADAIRLRIAHLSARSNFSIELLGQRSARPFGEDHNFGLQIVARFEVRFRLPFLIDALVVGADTDNAVALVKKF